MATYITGDKHGEMEMKRLSVKWWKHLPKPTEDDYVVVLGDFGLVFHPVQSGAEKWWLHWLSRKPWTTLFVDGNHDNIERLREYPTEVRFGGKVGKILGKIYHLRRGEVYEIEGKKIFVMGGAQSVDKLTRTEGIDWWRDELPTKADEDNAFENLDKHGWDVDYVLSHTCPKELSQILSNELGFHDKNEDPTTRLLDHMRSRLNYTRWYFGHYHINKNYARFTALYHEIIKLGERV